MSKRLLKKLLVMTVATAGLTGSALAGESAASAPPLVREIFVPSADLDALLEGRPQRMLLGRAEYEQLLAKAKTTPEEHAPHKTIVASADYTVTVEQGRARLVGILQLDVLEDGLWAVPLGFGGVGLRRASLDDEPASMAQSGAEQWTLFVEG